MIFYDQKDKTSRIDFMTIARDVHDLIVFCVMSFADIPDLYNPCYGGTIHSRLEPMTSMLLSRTS